MKLKSKVFRSKWVRLEFIFMKSGYFHVTPSLTVQYSKGQIEGRFIEIEFSWILWAASVNSNF